jgi:hypothetical protein
MPINDNVIEVLHKIRAKLYPNYLPLAKGKYIIRSTRHEAPLSVDAVCHSAKNRGGYMGNVDNMSVDVKAYHEECVFLLADGYSIKNKFFASHLKFCGTTDNAESAWKRDENPMAVIHTNTNEMNRVLDSIEGVIEGIADTDAYIDEVTDVFTGMIDDTLTPGETIIIRGAKIKIGGSEDVVGLFFTNESAETIQVSQQSIPQNKNSEIIAKIPDLAAGTWRMKIVTQIVGNTPLKDPRTIQFDSDLHVN